MPERAFARTAERLAACASALCAVECALAPFLPLALPSLAAAGAASEGLHAGLALLVLPASAALLGARLRRHRDRIALALGAASLCALAGAAILGFESPTGRVSTIAAGSALALAHLRGRSMCAHRAAGLSTEAPGRC
jgi:hypothetical protein